MVHYINQFFAGMGGEDTANVGVSLTPGTMGASRALQQALATHGSVIGTLVCGDNFIHDHRDEAMAALTSASAGPAAGCGGGWSGFWLWTLRLGLY